MKKILLVFIVVTVISCTNNQNTADQIYLNGTVITMNDSAPYAEAVAVRNGKILAVGQREEVLAYTNKKTKLIDLSNKTLLPGFVDPHSHLLGVGLQAISANLYPAPDGKVNSINDLISVLKKYKDSDGLFFKKNGWIIGAGYDNSQLVEKRHPTKFDLDKAFPDIPVYISHQSGHLGVANSKALELLKITENTQNPHGGIIQRVQGSQEPNGVLEEEVHITAFFQIVEQSPLLGIDIFFEGLKIMKSFGYTTAQDGRSGSIHVLLMKILSFFVDFSIDLVSYPDIFQAPKAALKASHTYKNRFRVGGMKISLDGSPQAKTAWRDRPYIVPPHGHAPDYKGYPAVSRENAFEKIELAFSNNIQVLAHANGEAAIDLFLDAVENAEQKYGNRDHRPVLIHGQFLRQDQVDRIKKLKIFPSVFPSHTFFWGDWHRTQTIGEPGVNHISPTKWLEDAGLMFTIHHDAPIIEPNNMRVLWSAVNRISRSGRVIGPEQRISVMTGLKALTIWSAYQYFEEDKKGSLEVGKLADLVILSENPLKVDTMKLSDIKVLQTIKEGKVVFDINNKDL